MNTTKLKGNWINTEDPHYAMDLVDLKESMKNASVQDYLNRELQSDIDTMFGPGVFSMIGNIVNRTGISDRSECDDIMQSVFVVLCSDREYQNKRSKGIVYESMKDLLSELPIENRKRYIARIAINEIKRYSVSQKRQKGNSGKFAKTLYYYVHNAPIYSEDPMDHACQLLDIDLYEERINAFTSWLRDSRENTVSAFWSLLKKAMDSDYTLNDQERKQLSRFRLAIREYLK